MVEYAQPPRSFRVLLTLASIVILIAGMRAAQELILPFLVSVFVAMVCAPIVFWMERKGLPAVLAVILVATALIGVGVGLGAIVGGSVNDFMARLPQYQRRLGDESVALRLWLDQMGVDLGSSKILASVNPGTAMGLVGNLLTSVGALFANALLIALTVTFILMEASSLPRKLESALGHLCRLVALARVAQHAHARAVGHRQIGDHHGVGALRANDGRIGAHLAVRAIDFVARPRQQHA
jgi:predicted PurR-regulated permease PerM